MRWLLQREAGHGSWASPECETFPFGFSRVQPLPWLVQTIHCRGNHLFLTIILAPPLLALAAPELTDPACHHRSGDAARARASTEE